MGDKLKIWIAGCDGQVGTALGEVADREKMELINTDKADLDITDLEKVLAFVKKEKPDVIINCAAVTDTYICMLNNEAAYRVNALGARNLAIAAREVDAKIAQMSTDDVFDGKSDRPYHEYDDTNPSSVYGRSKRAGERYVKEFTYKHFIFRSSWVYGKGTNYVKTLLRRTITEQEIAVADDQYGSPTSADELAKVVLKLVQTNEYGTYHVTCSGSCSRYELAKEVMRLAGKRTIIRPVTTMKAEISSARPEYTVLENFVLKIMGEDNLPDWKEPLKDYVEQLKKDRVF